MIIFLLWDYIVKKKIKNFKRSVIILSAAVSVCPNTGP